MMRFALAAGSFVFYQIVHDISEKYLVPKLDPQAVEKLDVCDRIDLPEKVPSTINGVFVGSLGLYIIFWQKAFEKDIINPYPPALDILFSSFVGYTVYDLKIMWSKPKEELSLWIHHILGLIGSSLILIFRQGAFFPALFSITEITVVPGNLVWLLQRLGLKEKKRYEVALALRAFTFVLFRTMMAPFCYYYAVNNPGPLSPYVKTILKKYSIINGQLPKDFLSKLTWDEKHSVLVSNLFQLPTFVPIICIAFVTLFGILNIGWSYVIVGNFLTRFLRPKPKPKIQKKLIQNSFFLTFKT